MPTQPEIRADRNGKLVTRHVGKTKKVDKRARKEQDRVAAMIARHDFERDERRRVLDGHRDSFISQVGLVETPKDVQQLLLALYISQGGEVTVQDDKHKYRPLELSQMPTVDNKVLFPAGYGATSLRCVIVRELTPNIDLTPGRSLAEVGAEHVDRRAGWEFGHSTVFELFIEKGELMLGTNVDHPIAVRKADFDAATKLASRGLHKHAQDVYRGLGIDEKTVKKIKGVGNYTNFIRHTWEAATSYDRTGSGDSGYDGSDRWKDHFDMVSREHEREQSKKNDKKSGSKKSSSTPAPSPSKTRRSSGSIESRSTVENLIDDPFGINDPGGTRDPAAGMARGSFLMGGFDF